MSVIEKPTMITGMSFARLSPRLRLATTSAPATAPRPLAAMRNAVTFSLVSTKTRLQPRIDTVSGMRPCRRG